MIVRKTLENDYRFLFAEYKYGTTIWSPLCGGILSGKYNDGVIPEDSRFGRDSPMLQTWWKGYMEGDSREGTLKRLRAIGDIAKNLGYT